MNPGARKSWCAAKVDDNFKKALVDVTSIYAEKYDPANPWICVDENLYMLFENTRSETIDPKTLSRRRDYEYKRNGTCNIFVALQPRVGKRLTKVTERRTRKDFAYFVKDVIDELFPEADTVRIICDNLNTHNEKSIIKTFDYNEAQKILQKVRFVHTPVHASWLNMVETEISVLQNQCLDRRIGTKEEAEYEIQAWEKNRNDENATMQWGFFRSRAEKIYGAILC